MTADPQVSARVTRHFTASPERVFDAWLDPHMLGTWMFGPCVTLDVRAGGRPLQER